MTDAILYTCPGYRPLLAKNGDLFASKGYRLFKDTADQQKFKEIAKYNPGLLSRLRCVTPYTAKFFREGFHDLTVRPDGAMVGIVRKGIVYAAPGADTFDKVLPIMRGSRPLKLCQFPDGEVAFGEYFSNGPWFNNKPSSAASDFTIDREEVHIYSSKTGKDWEIAYSFPPSTVRHVHGIFYDKYRDCAWILTGDLGQEAAIWVSYNRFRTVTPVARGSQAARAVWIFPMKDQLIVPMDSNLEQNYIHRMDPKTGEMTCVASLPGPVISGATGDDLVLSTMIDYSEIEMHDKVCILTSKDGVNWKTVAELDPKPDPFSHPRVQFATQSDDTRIFTYCINTKHHDGALIKWNLRP